MGSRLGPREPGRGHFMLGWAVKPATARDYTKAARRFIAWAGDNGGDDAVTGDDFDGLVVEYFQSLYLAGEGRSHAARTLSGLVHFAPWLVHQLPMARRALKGWTRRCPSVPWPPVTWPVAVAIAVRMVMSGCYAGGVGVLVSFDCLLRISELLQLRAVDVVGAGDARVGAGFSGLWLRLQDMKTGTNKSVRVRTDAVRRLLRGLVAAAPSSSSLLFSYSATTFRRLFKGAAAALGVSPDVVVHSLRHGGATHLFAEVGMGIAEIAEHGRWASVDSARHYLQQCRALLMARAAEPVVALGRRLAVDVARAIALAQESHTAAAAAARRSGR
jgi:integrase